MSNPFKPISISLIPNYNFSDVWRSFTLLWQPGKYLDQKPGEKLKIKIAGHLGKKYVILFESGRAAEYFLLKALEIGDEDEVIIQAFTCVAVPNSVLWTGAKPIYCDIDQSLNLDPLKLEILITKKTRAVIVQHTFGMPADILKIKKICDRHRIILIEDLAHGLGNKYQVSKLKYQGEKIGTVGEAAFLSFGRDKVISGIWGGAVATNSLSLSLSLSKLIDEECVPHRISWVAKQLLFAPLVYFILQTYSFFNLGKAFHKMLHGVSLLPKVLDSKEKQGKKPEIFYRGMPGALAKLTLAQLEKLEEFAQHRRELAKYFADRIKDTGNGIKNEDWSSLRYSILVDDPEGLRRFAAKRNIFLGDWYDQVVAPKGVNLQMVGYKSGSCPVAEEICQKIVNLPTNPNINLESAAKVVAVIKQWKLKK